jgi:hypothetical protein
VIGEDQGVEVVGDAGGEGFEEAVVADVEGEEGEELLIPPDGEEAQAVGLALRFVDGSLPRGGVEGGGGGGGGEELLPGGEGCGVGGEVVVAEGAEAVVLDGLVAAVEGAGKELAPGALEMALEWVHGGGHSRKMRSKFGRSR